MGFFSNQLLNVVEWQEYRDDQIFYKWKNDEIKDNSKLIIRPGQDAIFMHNGRIEGIFEREGEYDIASDIVPFLSTLKGFKFGFNSGMRAEVLFINTREFQIKWGTTSPISIQAPNAGPGGIPIRANGTAAFKVKDYISFIENVAGIKTTYTVDDVKEVMMGHINQLLMKWISKEGKDMFNLQANSYEISKGIMEDFNYELDRLGLKLTQFNIKGFNYPDSIQKMQEKVAAQWMVGDVNKYSQMAMVDSLGKGGNNIGGNMASQMTSMMMGMQMGKQMMGQMNEAMQQTSPMNQSVPAEYPKFCPNCGNPTDGANFCGNCGKKLK